MNYRAIALVTGGVMLGALTFSAIGVSAHSFEDGEGDGERRGHIGMNEERQGRHGEKHGMAFSEELLGMTTEELKAEREAGKTMEEVVTAQGYDSIESFKEAVEEKVREELAAEGLSEEEIDEKLEHREEHRQHRMEHLSENFDEDEMRERLSERGLSDEQIDERIQHTKDRIEEFNNQ